MLNARFFKKDDKKVDNVVFPLPKAWWSRPNEYGWAAEFVEPGDVVLDAGCGIGHPFKFFLADRCKALHAVDKDPRIDDPDAIAEDIDITFGEGAKAEFLENNLYSGIKAKNADICELPFRNNMFDKIFCISVFHQITESEVLQALTQFKRVLKNSGMVIITFDYPGISIETIERLASEAGLQFTGEKEPAIPADAIHHENYQLYCCRVILTKKKDGE